MGSTNITRSTVSPWRAPRQAFGASWLSSRRGASSRRSRNLTLNRPTLL